MNGKALPNFSAPPLTEVALSIQFEPLQRLVVPEIGLLWQHYGGRFSHVEQHPPLEPAIERLGVRNAPSPFPNIEMLAGPPLPRIWFLDDEKRELLQIQQDRFIRNWRQLNESDQYPRYVDHIRPKFLNDLKDFQKFIGENDIGDVIPNQCEVSYTNHILSGDVWKSHADIDKVFTFLNIDHHKLPHLKPEDFKFQYRYQIADHGGDFLGRLYVTVQPAYLQKDDLPIFILTLIARGKPLSKDIDGVIDFMDLGREYIVKTFSNITRPEMHKLWGRTEDC